MNDYLKIINVNNKIEVPQSVLESNQGEYLIYDKNIKQKKGNNINLNFTFYRREVSISNFGYSPKGICFAFIHLKEFLIIYNTSNNETIGVFSLPSEIIENLKDYIVLENRSFVKKMFSRLSFLDLNQKTNNIYPNEDMDYVIISSCKYYF